MIVQTLQSQSPLADTAVARKEPPSYGPGVPEYQETIQNRPREREAASHPWKVTSAGASSVDVAAGKVLGLRSTDTPGRGPWYVDLVEYAGEEVAVPGAGWLYAVATTEASEFYRDTYEIDTGFFGVSNTQKPTSVVVQFSASAPSAVAAGAVDEMWIPIAEVDIVDGQAVAVDQILTYNPMLLLETLAIA